MQAFLLLSLCGASLQGVLHAPQNANSFYAISLAQGRQALPRQSQTTHGIPARHTSNLVTDSLGRNLGLPDPRRPSLKLTAKDPKNFDVDIYDTDYIRPLSSRERFEVAENFAFVFDIDGVFLGGGKAIKEAREALRILNGFNRFRTIFPYIFLTNGGGTIEDARAAKLSAQLGTQVAVEQVIQGHTPFKSLVGVHSTVLVVGGKGENCRLIAQHYGFERCITPGDILKSSPSISPYTKLSIEEELVSKKYNLEELQIDAILVFADTLRESADRQIMVQILSTEGGFVEGKPTTKQSIPVYIAHGDNLWKTDYKYPRQGMGVFRSALEAAYKAQTGNNLNVTMFGKPQMKVYEFMAKYLREWRAEQYDVNSDLRTIYFVGDTMQSDILGTNRYNKIQEHEEWFAILVQTGVYKPGDTHPEARPDHVAMDIRHAVTFAIEREAVRTNNTFKQIQDTSGNVAKY